jgi:hypothetical protein
VLGVFDDVSMPSEVPICLPVAKSKAGAVIFAYETGLAGA